MTKFGHTYHIKEQCVVCYVAVVKLKHCCGLI